MPYLDNLSLEKGEATQILKRFAKGEQHEFDMKITNIRSHNGMEFKNSTVGYYCDYSGTTGWNLRTLSLDNIIMIPISSMNSLQRTPEQKGVLERNNHTLITLVRAMFY